MITLSNIHEFSDEEVFNYVATELIKQGKRSGTNEKCLYLSDDGSKCAVGLLMDNYHKEFDYCRQVQDISGEMFWTSTPLILILRVYYPKAVPRFRLLGLLQHIHDYFKPEEWQSIFAELRKELFNNYAIVIKNYKLEPYKVLTDRIKEYRASGCDEGRKYT